MRGGRASPSRAARVEAHRDRGAARPARARRPDEPPDQRAIYYSMKTIEMYLSRVYAKTGHASRLELIRAVDTGAVRLHEP